MSHPMNEVPNVWIVDDDADDQFLLAEAFKQIPSLVVIKPLSDGDELIPCLEQAPVLPKLILLDLNMQRQNGFDTLRELRSVPAYQQLPVVILTTSDLPTDKQRSLALGANDFLSKPPSIKGVITMLQTLIVNWSLN